LVQTQFVLAAPVSTKRLLFSWIGIADLRVMAADLPAEQQAIVLKGFSPSTPIKGQAGPLKTLLDQERFDEVHLLSDHGAVKDKHYLDWLGGGAVVHRVKIASPVDYREIFQAVDAQLSAVVNRPHHERLELAMHLSPGTPAMTAIWVLLGKSKYRPTTFYQTHEGRAFVTDIPFDLVVDYVPQVLRDADAQLQKLAALAPHEVQGFRGIAGNSQSIRVAVGRADRAARRDVPVLILGESGTGKELFARAIHDASPRRGKPFVAINCAAISRELLESELFGHKKGSFTGATENRDGAFKTADGGTLFLDEIGACDPAMQAKLLRALEPPEHNPSHRVFYRVGDSKPMSSDVRMIAATNRSLLDAIAQHEFRADLYYRLAVITIKLPPLRDRREDIPSIVDTLMERINQNFSRQEPGFTNKRISASAKEFVRKQSWPGNVRQLYNTLMQAAVMTDEAVVDRRDIADAVAEVPGTETVDLLQLPLGAGFSLEQHLEAIQRHYLRRAMEEARGVKKQAAELLGYRNYQTLAAQLERLDVEK
jgi:transcriptional regulator with PAS, ATPase and Fis domain